MINKEIQDYIDYLLFLKYDRQIVFAIVYYMLCILSQYIDYRKKRLPKEKYSEFCKRVYTRYL